MTPPPFRLLVTGSRRLTDLTFVADKLDLLTARVRPAVAVLHGACPAGGADWLAERWAAERGLAVERFPADLARHGKMAGPYRNLAMVDSRPDAAVAFRTADSLGTADCVGRCVMHRVPIVVYEVTLDAAGLVAGWTVIDYNRGRHAPTGG